MSSFDVTNELRLAKPRASEQLRERVMALGERPVREPRFSFSLPSRYTLRRVALVAVPAVVVVGIGGALIHGIANSGTQQEEAVRSDIGRSAGTTPFFDAATPQPGALLGAQTREKAPSLSALPPNTNRLQHYQAAMTVRVDGLEELSPSTQKAMRIARSLGGYVVSAKFNAAKQGNSGLVFRIPIAHVQQAIAKFSALGTIAAQNIRITDLQAQFNNVVKRIGALRVAIAKVDDKFADTSLSNEDRVRLEQQRARLTAALASLQTSKARTSKRAALATVSLGLTTRAAAAAKKPEHLGPLGRALHDAGNILQKEASWALYALIVLGPLVLIGVLGYVLIRGSRRLADRRLLESS